MKNKLLFMMFTMLGVPGIAAATTSYDLANSEYNFAVFALRVWLGMHCCSMNIETFERFNLIVNHSGEGSFRSLKDG